MSNRTPEEKRELKREYDRLRYRAKKEAQRREQQIQILRNQIERQNIIRNEIERILIIRKAEERRDAIKNCKEKRTTTRAMQIVSRKYYRHIGSSALLQETQYFKPLVNFFHEFLSKNVACDLHPL